MSLSEQFPDEMLPIKAISLTQGRATIIDPEDWSLVSQYKWCAMNRTQNKVGNYWYAVTHPTRPVRVCMHTMIMGQSNIDHVNRNTLDNRRVNLRVATTAENSRNRCRQSNNTSGHVGVYWDKHAGKWLARIWLDCKLKTLGTFKHKSDAINKRHEGQEKFYGEFAPKDCCDKENE